MPACAVHSKNSGLPCAGTVLITGRRTGRKIHVGYIKSEVPATVPNGDIFVSHLEYSGLDFRGWAGDIIWK